MTNLDYIRAWLKRPIKSGPEKDMIVLSSIVEQIENLNIMFDKPVAWAKMNSKGDLFDLRLQFNPYEKNTIPLYLRPDHAEQRQQIMQGKGQK